MSEIEGMPRDIDLSRGRANLPIATRVHHRGAVYSRFYDGGGWGWGTILDCKPQHDGSAEYQVQRDAAIMSDMSNEPTWWASYMIDRALPPLTG